MGEKIKISFPICDGIKGSISNEIIAPAYPITEAPQSERVIYGRSHVLGIKTAVRLPWRTLFFSTLKIYSDFHANDK
jgi:hypothetical protein